MNDPNEKKPQLIDPPFHIDLDKMRDDAEPKQLKEAPLTVNQQDSVEQQQQPASSTNNRNVAYPVPYPSPQQAPPVGQPNAYLYPTQPSVAQPLFQYPVQPSFATTQYPYPTEPSLYSFSTNFMDVTLSLTDMQVLKKENIKADIEIRKKGAGLLLELEKQRLSNDEKMRYQKELDTYKDQRNSGMTSNVISTNGLDNNTANSITVKAVVKGFIADRAAVRVHLHGKGNQEIQILSKEENRHLSISLQDLPTELGSYLEEILPDGATPNTTFIQRCCALLRTSIPKLTKSNLIILEPHQVMFMNGYLDILTWKFTQLSEEQRKAYYTKFSFDINYSHRLEEPVAFNALLADALNGDENAISLYWEQHGAILTPVSTLKKVFAFQGAHDGGKTRISNIIALTMPYEDTLVISNLAPISNDNLIASPVRLIQIQELGKNKIAAKQIVKLKAYADGSRYPGASSFKILLNTNYPITTDEDGNIEPALRNRLSILPFPKPMDNIDPSVSSFEELYFEKERPLIIFKALRAFANVLRNNNRFSYEFPPNVYVFDKDVQEQPTHQADTIDISSLPPATPSRQTQFKQLMNQLFTLCDDVNPDMTVKNIMGIVNHCMPGEFKDEASAGKRIRDFFGSDNLKSKRNAEGATCYNLALQN